MTEFLMYLVFFGSFAATVFSGLCFGIWVDEKRGYKNIEQSMIIMIAPIIIAAIIWGAAVMTVIE